MHAISLGEQWSLIQGISHILQEFQVLALNQWQDKVVREFLELAGLVFSADKIKLPAYCESVRLDVGLSVNAPQSAVWISRDSKVHVFGFEPVEANRAAIQRGDSPWPINLEPGFINHRINIIPCALLDRQIPEGLEMHVTKVDPGCSSILKPKTFEVAYTETVTVYSLSNFLYHFPFEVIRFISHLKIDVQGADIQVLEGARDYLDRIMCITVEVDTNEYEATRNSLKSIQELLLPYGFELIQKGRASRVVRFLKGININAETDDPTFLNIRLYKMEKPPRFWVYQRG
jgi:FkbM family methyltransferase